MKDDDEFIELFNALPKDLQHELIKAVEESDATSAEDLVSQIFVGECPQCLSSNTKDCEDVAEIEDITLGLCKDCGHIWCTECGRTVTKGSSCEHWKICERCTRKKDELGDCGIHPWECKKISTYEIVEDEDAIDTCAWCNKRIAKNSEVFSLGAKARKGTDLKRYRGSSIRLQLRHVDKIVPAMVPTPGSEARKAGNDVLFMLCSEQCAKQLKKALLKEKFTIV